MAKAQKKKQKLMEEAYKMKPMVILVLIVFVCIVATLVIAFTQIDFGAKKVNPKAIDCMPPMSQSETDCLDKGECYCVTY